MKNDRVLDIRCYEIAEGEFALFGFGTGKMEHGILCGKSCILFDGRLSKFSSVYKLYDEHLVDYEKKLKEKIQKKYQKHLNELNIKKTVPRVKEKDMGIGRAYATIDEKIYLYYGHGTLNQSSYFGKTEKTGYIYLQIGSCSFKPDYSIKNEYINKYIFGDMFSASTFPATVVVKNKKKFIAISNFKAPIFAKKFEYYYRDKYNNENFYRSDYKEILKFELD